MLTAGEKQLLLLNMCYHNSGLNNYFTRGYKLYQKPGLTKSLHDNKKMVDIVLRLMDNRDFDKMDDATKREMVYADYYPLEARTDKGVYLDDRRNLCQALHNKICESFSLPETIVKLVDFRKTDMDEDMFHFYNHNTGEIFINTGINYAECGETELAEAVIRATFIYQLHYELKNKFQNIDELPDRQKYLLLSTLMKTFVVESHNANGEYKKRDAIQYNDGCSAPYVYATFSTYEFLNRMFKIYNLTNIPQLKTFNEHRISYLSSLNNANKSEQEEDEEFEDEENVLFDPDNDEMIVEGEIEDDGCIMDDALDFDIDLLYETEFSKLNCVTEGELFNILKRELNSSSKDFFDFFGYATEMSFAEEYDRFKECCISLEESEEEME